MRRPPIAYSPTAATLSNGLRVIATPMPTARSMSIVLGVRAGSIYDPPNRAGLAHFLEHLIFKSTLDYSRHEIAAAMQRCGNRFDPTTSKETISIAATVPMNKVDTALGLMASVSQRPLFDPADLEIERQVVLEELRDWQVDPSKCIEALSDRTLWGSHPLGRDTAGTRGSIREISSRHVRRFHRKFFHPGNSVLSLAGPMDLNAMLNVVGRHFGAWRPSPGAAFPHRPSTSPAPAIRQGRRSKVLRRANTQQVWFSVSTTTPSYPEGYGAMLNTQLAQVLIGDGDGSRLWDGLRERLGLAYEVYATLDFYADTGVMSAMAAVGRGRAAQAIKETKRILADTVAHGFSRTEVARGKDALSAQIELVGEWNASNAARYAELALLDQDLITPAQELAMLKDVTAKDFNAFLRERLRWDSAAVCAIGEGPALSAVHAS